MDFYIINESGVIIQTTDLPELGEDFRRVPYFYETLMKIRSTQGFFPDRIVSDQFGAGNLGKFASIPTPDHKYILKVWYAGKPLTDLDR